jgi:regulator of nonsense transcripts 2
MVPAVLLMSKDVRKAERLAEIQKREAERAVKDKESQSLNGDVNKRGTLDGALKQLSVRVSEKKHEDTTTSASDLVKSITTKTTTTKEEEEEKNTTKSYDQDDDDDDDGKTLHTSAKLENLLDSLPFCVNANLVLNFAVDFCYLNSKAARARLVEKIFRAPRVALELLPYYSLLVAILSKVYDGIVEPLESLLCGEFRGLQNKKDVSFNRRESKIRNARFIGELIKFRVFAPKIAFYVRLFFFFLLFIKKKISSTTQVLRYCFQDFCHENVVIACTLLENCGRFLYRSKPTHAKCARQLEILMRLKENKVQDQNLEYLIDNAFYQCVPQTNQGIKKKERSPMYLYIRHLILNRLAPVQGGLMKNRHKKQRAVLRHVTKLIKKLDLRDQVTQNMLIKSFLSVTKGKFGSIKNVCGVLKALRFQKYDFITVRVIDSLLELIRSGLDVSDFRHNQRRVGQIKFLGEMLVSKLVSMNLIFETLYMLIEIGHPFPAPEKNDDGDNNGILPLRPLRLGEPRSLRSHPSVLCKADMPHDVFRIRLICVLLDTIVGVLKRGNVHAKRLDTFLLYFDRYVAFKWSLTLETKFMIENTIEDLRPGRDIPEPSLVNEAEEKVEIFEKSLNYDDTAYDDDAVEVTEQDDIEEENELEEKDEETDDDSETEEEQHQEEEEEEEEVEIKVQLIGREEHTTEVDVDFENALRSMMTSTTTAESVRSKLTNRNLDQLSIPVSLLGERSRTTSKATKNGVKFKLLNRRKGKILTKDIVIPERVSLSRYALLSRDTERQEREKFAKRILEGAERQELEGETGVAPLMKIQQPIIYQKNTQKNRKF